MQKPIATLAIGGLINATLLTRSRSQRTLLSVSYTR
jgi:Cu/Ag efflux pump CusA